MLDGDDPIKHRYEVFGPFEVPRRETKSGKVALDSRIERQPEIDVCIAASAEYEWLYDQPVEDNSKARGGGPFTVESLSPHRLAAIDENDAPITPDMAGAEDEDTSAPRQDFGQMILENLRVAGVQQAHKQDLVAFTSLEVRAGP